MDDLDNIKIEGSTSTGQGAKQLSHQDIILEQYRRCIIEFNRERTFEGIMIRETEEGRQEMITKDQYEIIFNCVDALDQTLSAETRKHKDIVEEMIKADSKIKKHLESERRLKKKYKDYYLSLGTSRNPDIEGSLSKRELASPGIKKELKRIHERFIKQKCNIYMDTKFPLLTLLLSRLGYLND